MTKPNRKKAEKINKEEVKEALQKMKNNKTVAPDEIPVEARKALGFKGISILVEL